MSPTRREWIRRAAAAGAWLAAGAPSHLAGPRAATSISVRARVLGIAQDGGLPHLGCIRACCVRARRDPGLSLRVASLGLAVAPSGPVLLVDATPDLPAQVHDLRRACGIPAKPGRPVDVILLTHAHIGHYAGLVHLGKEAMASRQVPVLGSRRMIEFLKANKPWSLLVEGGHVVPEILEPGTRRAVAPGLEVEPVPAPHREEISDTLSFLFHGPSRSLFYSPDTDSWSRWRPPVERHLERASVALLDGTFFDAGEVPWRDRSEIPHPTIRASMERLAPVVSAGNCRILFTHLNHSNPAVSGGSRERREIGSRGFQVAARGMEFPL